MSVLIFSRIILHILENINPVLAHKVLKQIENIIVKLDMQVS